VDQPDVLKDLFAGSRRPRGGIGATCNLMVFMPQSWGFMMRQQEMSKLKSWRVNERV
jgi:hypothetical protein